MSPAKGQVTAAGVETRAALLRAAQDILEREGVAGVTFRAVARAVGVSPMAPYRHFADGPRELLAAVAEEGVREMIASLGSRPASDPRKRVLELSLRYVRFGVEQPHLYRALFNEQLADPLAFYTEWQREGTIDESSARQYSSLDATKLQVFELFVDCLTPLYGPSAVEFALALAALLHGLVGEFNDEGLLRRASFSISWSAERQRMARNAVEVLVAGFDAS